MYWYIWYSTHTVLVYEYIQYTYYNINTLPISTTSPRPRTRKIQRTDMASLASVQAKFADKARWGDVFQHCGEAGPTPAFLAELDAVDLARQDELYRRVIQASAGPADSADFTPVNDVADFATSSVADKAAWKEAGLTAMADGRLALLVLAGGAGTRLGFDHPKGLYDIELPSHRSLFELHCKRLLKLEEVCAARKGLAAGTRHRIQLYVMTSPANDAETQQFFQDNAFFGLEPSKVRFFAQGMLPCFSNDGGKLMLETPNHLAMAADGNGGIYPAMHNRGVLQHMEDNGIDYVHTICIDNALVLGLDPAFMGFVVSQNAEVGSLVVPKRDWEEKIGMLVQKDGKFAVAEYSDVSDAMKQETDPDTGALRFLAGNICIHAYSLAFLRDKVVPNYVQKINPAFFHIARKQIPLWDPAQGKAVKPAEKNGVKLEMFIFDVFEFASKMAIMQVERQEQFSPVKNKSGEGVKDSPATCREMFSQLHRSWLAAAGFTVAGDGVVEIDPEVSYRGEGLDDGRLVAALGGGTTVTAPCRISRGDGNALVVMAGDGGSGAGESKE